MEAKDSVFWATAVMAAVTAAMALLHRDWMLVLADALLVLFSHLCRDSESVPAKLRWMPVAGSAAIFIIQIIWTSGVLSHVKLADQSVVWLAECLVLPAVTSYVGLLVATYEAEHRGSSISYGWRTMFAVAFTMAFGALYIFSIGYSIWAGDEPFFNADAVSADHMRINGKVMLPSLSSIPGAILLGAVIRNAMGHTPHLPAREPYAQTEHPEWARQRVITAAICIVAFAVLMTMALWGYLENSRREYEFFTGTFCAVFALLPALFYRFKVMRLPPWFVFFIELAIFLHAYGVMVMDYDNLEQYDTVTHTISSFVIAQCILMTLKCLDANGRDDRFTTFWTAVFTIVIMAAFGNIWESFEYTVDVVTGTHMQYSPFDTVRDMLSNMFGAAIGSALAALTYARKPSVEFSEGVGLHPKLRGLLKHGFWFKERFGRAEPGRPWGSCRPRAPSRWNGACRARAPCRGPRSRTSAPCCRR